MLLVIFDKLEVVVVELLLVAVVISLLLFKCYCLLFSVY